MLLYLESRRHSLFLDLILMRQMFSYCCGMLKRNLILHNEEPQLVFLYETKNLVCV